MEINGDIHRLDKLEAFNLRDRVEKELRDAILSGIFRPGQKLVESDIAEQLDVSRAPVREALTALERDGLVIDIFRRGYFVAEFTEEDIEEIYSLRLILEIGGLRRAYPLLIEKDFKLLQGIIDELGFKLSNHESQNEIVNIDLSFHEYILLCAKNKRLHEMWNKLRTQSQLLISVTSQTRYEYPGQPKAMHQSLLDAIQFNGIEGAEKELTFHILDAQERAIKTLEEYKWLIDK